MNASQLQAAAAMAATATATAPATTGTNPPPKPGKAPKAEPAPAPADLDAGTLRPDFADAASKRKSVPHSLRLASNVDPDKTPYDEQVRQFGLWRVRLLRAVWIYRKPYPAGTVATVPGPLAVQLTISEQAEIIDEKAVRQAELMDAAAKLGLKLEAPKSSALPMENDPRKRPGKKNWATDIH